MSEHVNYYDILEISKTASTEEIKKAYSKLAKKWHPDRNPDTVEEATKKFKEIAVAYGVLSDSEKKQIYDTHGYEGLQQSSNGSNEMDPMEMLQQFMGGMGGMGDMGGLNEMFGNMFGRRQQADEKCGIPDVQIPLQVSLSDAYNGLTTTVDVEKISICDKCEGTGAKDKTTNISCTPCKGSGKAEVHIRQGPMIQVAQIACKNCKGTGLNPTIDKCKKCNGEKGIKETVKQSVTVPKGIFEKMPVVIENEGHAIPKDRIKGVRTHTDLVVVVLDTQTDETFKRGPVIPEKGRIDPADLMIEIDLTFVESLSGFYKEIKHLDGHSVKISLNEPCRHRDTYVIKNEGMPRYEKPNQFGDLVVQFNVEHPKTALVDDKLKIKIVDSLGGKHFKLSKKIVPHEMMTIEQYRKNAKIKSQSEEMRNQFKRGHGHQCENDDCEDGENEEDLEEYSDSSEDGMSGMHGMPNIDGMNGMAQQCAQS